MLLVHGTCVEIEGIGVLITGRPGSGKSDLALRLLDAGAGLVADDYLWLEATGGELVAKAHERIAGLLEVRGLGIVRLPYRETCGIGLRVELVEPDAVPRIPEPGHAVTYEGIAVRSLALAPFEASAPAKVRLAVRALRDGIVVTE